MEFTEHSEKILRYLKDKEWIEISKIEQHAGLPGKKLMQILEFLEYSAFINFDVERKKIRISDKGKMLLDIP